MDAMFRGGNVGLKSRFNFDDPFRFEALTDPELLLVFNSYATRRGAQVSLSVARAAVAELAKRRRMPAFANAREVETMISNGLASMQARVNAARSLRAAAEAEGKRGAALPVIPSPQLVLEDLVREVTSVEKARGAFASMAALPSVMEQVESFVALAEDARESGIDPATVASEAHMVSVAACWC